jgi:hypothetical protein
LDKVSLLNYTINYPNSAKEYQVLLIGYMAKELQFNIFDYEDKSQISPNKNISRIIHSLTHNFMKETNFNIQKACSKVFSELYLFCTNHTSYEQIINSYISPLINGLQNMTISECSSICLSDLLVTISNTSNQNNELMKKISQIFLQFFIVCYIVLILY